MYRVLTTSANKSVRCYCRVLIRIKSPFTPSPIHVTLKTTINGHGERKTLNQQTLIVVGCLRRAFQRSIIYANVPLRSAIVAFSSAATASVAIANIVLHSPGPISPFGRKGLRLCSNINNHIRNRGGRA
jgi:hypothetical protein